VVALLIQDHLLIMCGSDKEVTDYTDLTKSRKVLPREWPEGSDGEPIYENV
jgi:hypothetical protein